MSKNILELSKSFLLLIFGICFLIITLSTKSLLDTQKQLLDISKQNNEQILKTFEDSKGMLTEIAYASAVIAMGEQKIIPQSEVNKILEETIINIDSYSNKFGKLAQYINNFRIDIK